MSTTDSEGKPRTGNNGSDGGLYTTLNKLWHASKMLLIKHTADSSPVDDLLNNESFVFCFQETFMGESPAASLHAAKIKTTSRKWNKGTGFPHDLYFSWMQASLMGLIWLFHAGKGSLAPSSRCREILQKTREQQWRKAKEKVSKHCVAVAAPPCSALEHCSPVPAGGFMHMLITDQTFLRIEAMRNVQGIAPRCH